MSDGSLRWAVVLLLALGVPAELAGQDVGLQAAREAVGRYSQLERAVRGDSGALSLPNGERVDLPAGASRFALYRIEPGRSHASPLLVGWADGRVYRLGGFDEVALTAAAEALGLPAQSRETAAQAARVLAFLADPHGAEQVAYVGAPSDTAPHPPAIARWRDSLRAQPEWPRDTVLAAASGLAVRLLVLSRGTGWAGARYWTPIQYAFWFSPAGQLSAWRAWRGEQLTEHHGVLAPAL